MANGSSILRVSGLSEEQQACVDMLEEALAEAKRGAISSVGIIACMDGGFASVMAGRQAADLNLGCDEMKRKILERVTGKGAAPVKGSILKVTR